MLQCFLSGSTLCITGVRLMGSGRSTTEIYVLITYILIIAYQLFAYCFLGNELTFEVTSNDVPFFVSNKNCINESNDFRVMNFLHQCSHLNGIKLNVRVNRK